MSAGEVAENIWTNLCASLYC